MRLLAHAHDQCFVCFLCFDQEDRKTTLIFWLQNRGLFAFRSQCYNPYCSEDTKGRGLSTLTPFYLVFTCWSGKKSTTERRRSQQAHGKNSTLTNLEENLFSMMDENTSLLSETQQPDSELLNTR